jgi:hypothetical protein
MSVRSSIGTATFAATRAPRADPRERQRCCGSGVHASLELPQPTLKKRLAALAGGHGEGMRRPRERDLQGFS